MLNNPKIPNVQPWGNYIGKINKYLYHGVIAWKSVTDLTRSPTFKKYHK